MLFPVQCDKCDFSATSEVPFTMHMFYPNLNDKVSALLPFDYTIS